MLLDLDNKPAHKENVLFDKIRLREFIKSKKSCNSLLLQIINLSL